MVTTWVLLAGLPGTGKSTLAHTLVARLENAVVLSKDDVRATLFPGAMLDYSSRQDSIAMRAILEAASYLTAHQQPSHIFFDGRTFSRRTQIEEVLAAATTAGAQWHILHLACDDAVAEARLESHDPTHPAQNRTVALYRRVKASFEPITQPALTLDTTHGIEGLIEAALSYLQT